MTQPLLQVTDLRTRFRTPEGIVHAVNGISLYLNEGETVAVVGESGLIVARPGAGAGVGGVAVIHADVPADGVEREDVEIGDVGVLAGCRGGIEESNVEVALPVARLTAVAMHTLA